MTRHSRNCTANSVYSYHERKNDAAASGYGALAARYGKDGVKNFDCCSISLHPCKNPVVNPQGYLFDKETAIEYIIAKKNEIRKKTIEFEKQGKQDQRDLEEIGAAEQRAQLEKFLRSESGSSGASSSSKEHRFSNMKGGLSKKLPSFWVPSLTPDSKTTRLHKPSQKVLCPMSDKPLRLKDLSRVKFTQLDPSASFSALEGHKERYKCPVTGDVLRNSVPCAVLRTTGDVVTMEAVALCRKDMKHPLTGEDMTEADIIPLQRGGTGYAAANEQLNASKARPVMQA